MVDQRAYGSERPGASVSSAKTHELSDVLQDPLPTHCRIASQCVLDLNLLPGHCPVELSLHFEQALVHLGFLRELGNLGERMRDGPVS